MLEATGRTPTPNERQQSAHHPEYLVFKLDDQRYAILLPHLDRIVQAVEITLLPRAPDVVAGIINYRGRVIPVINLRRRFRLPERELEVTDRFILVHSASLEAAIIADSVEGVEEIAEQQIDQSVQLVSELPYLKGIARTAEGLVLIQDLDQLLSQTESGTLAELLPAPEDGHA